MNDTKSATTKDLTFVTTADLIAELQSRYLATVVICVERPEEKDDAGQILHWRSGGRVMALGLMTDCQQDLIREGYEVHPLDEGDDV